MRVVSSGRLHATVEFGDLQVISLRDGYIDMATSRLRDENGCPLEELPAAAALVGDNVRLAVNAFLVTDGTRSVLIDTGASDAWHDPTMGLIYDALDEAGIDRAQVTDVAITHNHEDHVSGLIAPDGTEAFAELERVWIGAGDTSVFTGRPAPIRDRVVPVSDRPRNPRRLRLRAGISGTTDRLIEPVVSGPQRMCNSVWNLVVTEWNSRIVRTGTQKTPDR